MTGPLPRILVADDEELMRLKLKRFLEQTLDVEVLLARDGEEAWRLVSTEDIRFVITDWMMPGLDGPHLCSRIRELRDRPYIYCVLLTGRTEQEDVLAGMDSGADDYLRKPVDLAELKLRVAAGLRVLELERSLERKNRELADVLAALDEAIHSASRVQQDMLPTRAEQRLVHNRSGLRLAYNCQFCQRLGGDVLGLAMPAPDCVVLFLADVSGHGIAAAVSAVCLHTYIQACLQTTQDPLELVSRVNHFCCDELPEQVYASLIFLRFIPSRREVSAIVAGHPPILLASTEGVVRIESTIPPLGLFEVPPEPVDVLYFKLEPHQRMVIYTDGVNETRNLSGEFFSIEQLEQSVLSTQPYDLESVPDIILRDVAVWRGSLEDIEDDMTVVALEFDTGFGL